MARKTAKIEQESNPIKFATWSRRAFSALLSRSSWSTWPEGRVPLKGLEILTPGLPALLFSLLSQGADWGATSDIGGGARLWGLIHHTTFLTDLEKETTTVRSWWQRSGLLDMMAHLYLFYTIISRLLRTSSSCLRPQIDARFSDLDSAHPK
jgi:hypothetical protein